MNKFQRQKDYYQSGYEWNKDSSKQKLSSKDIFVVFQYCNKCGMPYKPKPYSREFKLELCYPHRMQYFKQQKKKKYRKYRKWVMENLPLRRAIALKSYHKHKFDYPTWL